MAPNMMLVSAVITAMLLNPSNGIETGGLRGNTPGVVTPEITSSNPSIIPSTTTTTSSQMSSTTGSVTSEISDILIAKDWLEELESTSTPLPENFMCSDSTPCKFMMIADLDSGNRIDKGNKMYYESALMSGEIKGDGKSYNLFFNEDKIDLKTEYNEGGRGGELSELTLWGKNLLTADDRTGIIYQISQKNKYKLLPRFIFNEGDGSKSAKGFKIEWMTTKDNKLVVGSHGNPRKDDDGVLGDSLKWVLFVDKNGQYSRQNWSKYYDAVTKVLGGGAEGYTTHESIEWSDILRRWIILPRRLSKFRFDSKTDDYMGTNMMASCDEYFSSCKAIEIKGLENGTLRGFSSFKFVPGTHHQVIAAIRSAEDNANNTQQSYLSLFNIDGKVLVPEIEVPNSQKLEGFAFI